LTSVILTTQLYLIRGQQPITADGPCVFAASGRRDLPPQRLTLPLNWNLDPFQDRNWCAQLHMWRMIDEYLFQFEKTADECWLRIPLEIIEDYGNFHLTQGKRSRYAWKDMMVGLRAMKLAFIMSLHNAGRISLSGERLNVFRSLIDRHAEFLSDIANVRYSNHTFIDLHGAKALCQVMEGSLREGLEVMVALVLPKLLGAQFSPAGVHLENSAKYQLFGLGCLQRLKRSRWFAAYEIDSLYARAERIKRWLQLPDGRLVPFGDTGGSPPPVEAQPLEFAGEQGVLNESGYVVIRQPDPITGISRNASYLFFMGAFNSIFHKHQDDLSFVWFEGQDILCDAGQYAYKSDRNEEYILSTRAHNTIEIDEINHYESTGHDKKQVYGSAIRNIEQLGSGYAISARVEHRRFESSHSRTLLFSPGNWLIVIDQLDSIVEHLYTQWFHFCPSLNLTSEGDGRFSSTLSDQRKLTVLTTADANLSTIVVRGQTEPRMQGWISRGYRKMEPNDTLGISCRGRSVKWITMFIINDINSESTIDSLGNLQIHLRTANKIASQSLELLTQPDATWSIRISTSDMA
jgi:Heparinase II/III-like protein